VPAPGAQQALLHPVTGLGLCFKDAANFEGGGPLTAAFEDCPAKPDAGLTPLLIFQLVAAANLC
jgi:hypothetical protein